MKKLISNIFYNSLYQVLIILAPLITIPYVARYFSPSRLGISSLVMSVATFMSIVILMGMNQLGAREVAANKDNPGSTFEKLWSIQKLSGLICIIVYLGIVLLVPEYKLYFLIGGIFVIGYIMDISWLFIGLSDIRKVIIRNSTIKVFSIILIFIFIKSKDDLWIYLLINSLSILLSNILFLTMSRKYVSIKNLINFNLSPDLLKKALIIVLPQIALQFYTSFDGTLVGILSNTTELSYYDQSQKIARIVLAILTSASLVVMPKMVELSENKSDESKFWKVFDTSLDYTLIFSSLITIVLLFNAKAFIPWFFGERYSAMGINMMVVSVIVIFISYGGVFANQLAVSRGLYKEFSIPYIVGAVINVTLNLLTVKKYGSLAGSINLAITELVVCAVRVYMLRNVVNLTATFKRQLPILITFVSTILIVMLFRFTPNGLVQMLVLGCVIALIYLFILICIFKEFRIRFLFISKRLFKGKK